MALNLSGTTGIVTANIATLQVTTGRLADDAVTPEKLSQPMTLATAQVTTSGTTIDFTSIPSWAKRITVMFNSVSNSGTSSFLIRLGTSAGVENSSYKSQTSISNTSSATQNSTTGFIIYNLEAAAQISGAMTLTHMGGNLWASAGTYAWLAASTASTIMSGGSKLLTGGVLNQIQLTTVSATAFDLGSVNILYEG